MDSLKVYDIHFHLKERGIEIPYYQSRGIGLRGAHTSSDALISLSNILL